MICSDTDYANEDEMRFVHLVSLRNPPAMQRSSWSYTARGNMNDCHQLYPQNPAFPL